MFKKLVYHDLIRTVGLYLINKEELLISSNLINEFVDFAKRRGEQINGGDIAKLFGRDFENVEVDNKKIRGIKIKLTDFLNLIKD